MADFARGERLKQLRDARHLSQEDAAHEIGVSVKTLRSWEKGAGIRWRNAQSVAAFYGVEPESLVSRELPEPSELPHPDDRIADLEDRLVELLAAVAALDAKLDEALDRLPQQQRGEPGAASGE